MTRWLIMVLALLFGAVAAAQAGPPPERLAVLQRGINLTNWFRYPPSRDPASLRHYLSANQLSQLKQVGFSFVRLPVQPEVLAAPGVSDALIAALRALQQAKLGVVIVLHADHWHLETNPADRANLVATWQSLGRALQGLDPRLTYPELLNEPIFQGDAAGWVTLQHLALTSLRHILPDHTIILTGADWGSVDGLPTAGIEADSNTIYSVHLYDPAELTALAAYRADLDTEALTRLPFPAGDIAACQKVAEGTASPPTAALIRFYCTQNWTQDRVATRIAQAAAWGQSHHVSVLLGEFGASNRLNSAARLAWLTTVRATCERFGLGWALWGYDDSMGFAIRPGLSTRRLDPEILSALGLGIPIPSK